MEIITAYATKNDCYKKAQKMTPKGIVVHSTDANNPNLKRYVDAPNEVGTNQYGNHWNQPGLSKCVHAFIGYDKNNVVKVANILPYNYCCWGCASGSKGSYNYDPAYIQFEMCEDDCKHKEYFEAVYKTAVDYCVYLCKEFDIPVENIVSHKEAHDLGYGNNHSDPHNWWDNFGRTMDDFRAAVRAGLAPVAENGVYRVQTGAFSKRENAEAQVAKLKAAGFDAYIVSGEETPATPWTPAVGDKVKCKPGVTKYANGNTMSAWVPTATLYIRAVESNGKILLVSTEATGNAYTGRVNASDVEKA